jgi:hypothetical protein
MLSQANFRIQAFQAATFGNINNMTDERGLPRQESNCCPSNLFALYFQLFHSRMCFIPEYAENIVTDTMEKTAEPENRLAFIVPSVAVDLVLYNSYRSGVSSIFIAEENVSTEYLGFMMHIALRNIIRLKASQYFESGIFSTFFKKAFYKDRFMSKQDEVGPQVLTLQHLSAGFVVICGLLIVSMVVFAAECGPKLVRDLKKWFKKWVEVCLLCYIVVKFTRMNKML